MFRKLIKLAVFCSVLYVLWPYNVFLLKDHNPSTTSLIQLRTAEAKRLGHQMHPQMEWRSLSQISPALIHAVILAEDDRFYVHHGFDMEQILIALQLNWSRKRYVYGGSTITQQLARTLFLRPRKTILRKLKEAVLTIYLEATLPKRRILELYLNAIEWGPGIYGAEAASEYYFWRAASELTPDEAVALASILPSPRRWNPFSEKAFMARRRTQLLERMQKAGYAPYFEISPTEEPLPFAPILSPPPDPNSLSEPEHPPASDATPLQSE